MAAATAAGMAAAAAPGTARVAGPAPVAAAGTVVAAGPASVPAAGVDLLVQPSAKLAPACRHAADRTGCWYGLAL